MDALCLHLPMSTSVLSRVFADHCDMCTELTSYAYTVVIVEDFNDKTSFNSKHIIMMTKEIKTKRALYAYKNKESITKEAIS